MRIGLILPHFGRHVLTSRLLGEVAELERLGFDSIWARDHVVYAPHAFEDPDITFIDPLLALAAAGVASHRLVLGTATLIPHRHPIQSALLIASLARLVGPDRLLIAWGIGNDPREFAAVAAPGRHRGARLDEHVEVVRRLLTGEPVSHKGEHYRFDDVRITAPGGRIQFWYGGGTPSGIERAGRGYDGLLASRTPRSILRERIDQLRSVATAAGRPEPTVGLVALVSPAPTVAEGLAAFDVERIQAELARRFPDRRLWPGPGLDGLLIAGPPGEIVAEIEAFAAIGVSHLVLDLRARFDAWETLTAQLAEDVLPHVRRDLDGPR